MEAPEGSLGSRVGGEGLVRQIAVADLHVGDHVELGQEGYDVSDVEQRSGQVEVVDTAGSVHIYSSGAVVSVR